MSFREVEGHELQIEQLRRAIKSGRVSHAYLFAGLEGIGKRFVALSFAQALNCKEEPGEGCGQCLSCTKIGRQIHPDCMCLEAEGNSIKIDQIRDLQNRIVFYPFEGKRKIVIINDAEKMTPQAANCLLKSLEEPLPDTVFILITQELKSLLPTIVSRCQIIRFQPLPTQFIRRMVEEKYKGRELMVDVLLSLSGGSLGRACEMVERGFMVERERLFDQVTRLREEESISSHLNLAEEMTSVKEDVAEKLELLKTWYHDLMMYKRNELKNRVVNTDLREKIGEESSHVTLRDLFARWRVVRETQSLLRRNVNPQLVVEHMLITLAGGQE
jgi:DNA polymerase-3 subunit delta'